MGHAKSDPSDNIDWICSTAKLEHIPPAVIEAIMIQGRRILKPDGRSTMIIDYHDHYTSTDKSITPYNFYRYSNEAWCRYNPRMHYVNRLRHSDFVSLFGHLDFDITECRAMTALDGSDMLSGIPVAGDFNKYDTEDVAITTGVFMLVPRAA